MDPDQEQLRLKMEMEAEAEAERPHTETLTESPEGVKRMEVKATAPDLSEAEAPEKKGFLDKIHDALRPESSTGALATGFSKGATMGFGDELYGALSAVTDVDNAGAKIRDDVEQAKKSGTFDPSAAAPQIPGVTSYTMKRPGEADQSVVRAAKTAAPELEQPMTPDIVKAYTGARDSMRKQYDTAEKEHRGLSITGELLGSLAVPIPGPGKAKGLAKVGKYALQGAGIGTVAGLGNSEADLTEGEGLDAGSDTLWGGLTGAGFGAVLGAGAAKLDPYLEQMAARRAYKALDPYMKKIEETLRTKLGRHPAPKEIMREVEKLGKRVLDEGIIPEGPLERFADSETIGDRSKQLLDDAGVLKGAWVDDAQNTLTKAGKPNPVSTGVLATRVEQAAAAAALDPDKQPLARKLAREAEEIRQSIVRRAEAGYADPAAVTLQEAEKHKKGFQDAALNVSAGKRGGPGQEAKEMVARLAKEQAENAIESGIGPDDLEQFIAIKNRYGDLADITDTASHGALRDFRNQSASMGDKLAAIVASNAAKGGPEAIALGAAGGAANHFANARGSAGLARTLTNASKSNSLLTPAATEPWSQFLRHRDDDENGPQ